MSTFKTFTIFTTQSRITENQWFRRWDFSLSADEKRLGHSLQTYGFTESQLGWWCLIVCFFSSWRRMNFLSHTSHVNQLPTSCVLSRWLLSWSSHVKLSAQCGHEYGLASVCTRAWRVSSSRTLNSIPQQWHWCGRRSLCTRRRCSCTLLDCVKRLSHSAQRYGFSPVCTRMCVRRCSKRANALSHSRHRNSFSAWTALPCRARPHDVANCLPQMPHASGLSPEWLRSCSTRCILLGQHLPHSAHRYLPLWIFICQPSPPAVGKRFSHSRHGYKHSPPPATTEIFRCDLQIFTNTASHRRTKVCGKLQ